MIVQSNEKRTGMGAIRYSAILQYSEVLKEWYFIKVSEIKEADYLGRNSGVEEYQVEVPEDTIWAKFYRSNSGKESVQIFKGKEESNSFNSFHMANKWAKERE